MKVLKLDRKRILDELAKRKKSSAWLAREIGCTRQSLHENIMRGSIKRVGQIGEALGITPKLLVKTVDQADEEDE